MTVKQYNFPNIIKYGPYACQQLPDLLKQHDVGHPLLVTDSVLATLPPTQAVLQPLKDAELPTTVFSELGGNPVKSQVTAGVDAYKAAKADAIIALGGGAAMDVAKAIALMVHHPGDLFDYEDGKPDARPVDQPIPFMIAIPTTAGTGSEVGRSAVISDDETKVKKIIFDPKLLPSYALLDPLLTLNLPASITASTGMDALSHLVEAYLTPGFSPMCDGIALEGIRLAAETLQPVFRFAKQPTSETSPPEQHEAHIEARGKMLFASLMGAVAFQKGLGVTHSCAHALSTVCDLHHGLANGILLPYTMTFNAKAVPERFVELARAAGLQDPSPTAFITWLRTLQHELEIPTDLGKVGVKAEHIDALVQFALQDGCHLSNPCPVSEADFRHLFTQAIEGTE